jgi:hypothetical protein
MELSFQFLEGSTLYTATQKVSVTVSPAKISQLIMVDESQFNDCVSGDAKTILLEALDQFGNSRPQFS